MDEKLFYTIFTIVYISVHAREGDYIVIGSGRDIEAVRAAADGMECVFDYSFLCMKE